MYSLFAPILVDVCGAENRCFKINITFNHMKVLDTNNRPL